MPYNAKKSASKDSKSVLRFTAPFGVAVKNVVLDANDATAFPAPTDGSRFIVPAGTILVDSTVSGKVTKLAAGTSNKKVVGILKESIDLIANSTEGYEPAAAYFSMVVFATEQIVDFTVFNAKLVADLNFCQFQ